MNTKLRYLKLPPLVLALAVTSAFAQPSLTIKLVGVPQNSSDVNHLYQVPSASLGANLSFQTVVSGGKPTSYSWSFDGSDLPTQTNASLILTNVQTTADGAYSVIVQTSTGPVTNDAVLSIDTNFTKITTGPIVTAIDLPASGGTWADYDRDGRLDLLVFHGASSAPKLYHNNTNGTFTLVTVGAPNNAADGGSATWGDYDNDGWLDLCLATSTANILYHNDGTGKLVRQSSSVGPIVTDKANTSCVSWADFDNDGFLDMFTSTFDSSASSYSFLYRNNGNGTFTSVTNSPLVTDIGSAVGASWSDYDNDGHIDLFVAGGRGGDQPPAPNRLYHNNGDGTFARITNGPIATDMGHCGIGIWGDYDNDGYLDLFAPNVASSTNFLYHNNGDGTFTRITNSVVAQDTVTDGGTGGAAWGDYDNDGFLDLFVSNFSQTGQPPMVNFLYHNNGDGSFTKVLTGSIPNEFSDTAGCTWVDYDNDGFLDLFAVSDHGQGNYLYHNNGNSNAWLTVRPVGTASNRSAIGAKIRVKAHYRGQDRWQVRQISSGQGWEGHDELQANFGLGDATNVDTLRIEWPSGTVTELFNITPKQILTVTEPAQIHASVTNGVPQFILDGGRNLSYRIDSSVDLRSWNPLSTTTITNASGSTEIIDTNSPDSAQRFYRATLSR